MSAASASIQSHRESSTPRLEPCMTTRVAPLEALAGPKHANDPNAKALPSLHSHQAPYSSAHQSSACRNPSQGPSRRSRSSGRRGSRQPRNHECQQPHWRNPHQIHVLALTGVAYETQATTAVHSRVLGPLRDLVEERDTYTRHRCTSLGIIAITAIRLASCDVCEALVPAGVNPRVQESQGRESAAEAGVVQECDDGGCDWGGG